MPEQRLWSATTLISLALGTSKPLVEWNVTQACETAYDKIKTLQAFHEDGDRDGAVKWLKDSRWTKSGQAMARGTEIHRAAEQYALGAVPEVDPAVQPYVDQYRRFLEDFQPEFLMAEAPVYNLSAGYAGTLDAVATVQRQSVVLDIKTTPKGPDARSRPPYPEAALQLCLYRHAELVGLLADRREVQYRRYYVFDPSAHAEPMPETDGAVCVVVSPVDYMVVPVDTSTIVWNACRHLIEVARFQVETSKTVFGPVLSPQAPEMAMAFGIPTEVA